MLGFDFGEDGGGGVTVPCPNYPLAALEFDER